MATPRYRSFLGINKEAAHAAGVDPTYVAPSTGTPYWIPCTDLKPFDNIKYLDDVNWRGSMVQDYGTVQGNIFSEFEFSGDVFPDTFGWAVAGVLGKVTTTGASAPYTHVVTAQNTGTGQATSYSLTDYNGYNRRKYTGMQFGSVDLKFNAEGLLEYTAMAQGWASATTADTTANAYSTVTTVPVWTGTTTIGGTTVKRLGEGDLKISRALTPIFTVDGNQSPYQLFQGPLEVTGSLKLIYEDDTDLSQFLNNSQPSLDIAWSQGSGAGATKVQVTMTQCAFQVAKIDRSKDFVELDVTYRAISNTTDAGASNGYSPIKVTLQNAVAASVYA